jgi:PTS system cellobiose-specific IIC component
MNTLALRGGTPVRTRPFTTWPIFGKEEEARLLRALRSGHWGRLQGTEVAEFENRFAAMHGCRHGIAVVNGTVSLRIALLAAGIRAEDEVIVPPYTFVATASAVVEANLGNPLPYVTALGFFTTFVNIGGIGATIALALLLWNSRDAGFRRVSRLSLPTQIFQINEPIFFGLPIVLNPLFIVPYVLNALLLTAGTYLLMYWSIIGKPFVSVPWTTPPIVGHYLVTGGDWKAAVWGAASIVIAMAVYFPFARSAERQRGKVEGAS